MNSTEKKTTDSANRVNLDFSIQQVLNADGQLVGELPALENEQLLELFRLMVKTRAFDENAMRLQRTGRIPFYYACGGMETHVAIPFVLEDQDWVFGAYREQGVRLARGVPMVKELALWRGLPNAAWDPNEYRITPLNVTIGTHIPQTTGYSYASRFLKKNEVALSIFGDGGTSEGDFHGAVELWEAVLVEARTSDTFFGITSDR